jgi:hypothetical protein
MNQDQPSTSPAPPKAKPSKTEIAITAFVGFVIYLVCCGLAILSRSAMGLVFLALPIAVALYTGITGNGRGFALGVAIGIGMTLLAFGMCVTMAS